MQKKITFIMLILLFLAIFAIALVNEAKAEEVYEIYFEMYTETVEENVAVAAIEPEIKFDPEIDYTSVMVSAVINDDIDTLITANMSRNAKIDALSLDVEKLDAAEFVERFEEFSGFALDTDYMELMVKCCVSGDVENGEQYAQKRNLKIRTTGCEEREIAFNDLFLLSKIITAEAGSYWLSDDWKMMVGEVLVNRVESSEFPDTFDECIYQKRQYYSRHCSYFHELLPNEDCVLIALKLLNGERIINDPSVVFQANFPQGSGIYIELYDELLGHTYLCYSNNMELYK